MAQSASIPAALAALLCLGGLPVPAQSVPPGSALHGEYGLFVSEEGDSIIVRWITRQRDAGALLATAGARVVHEQRTPEAQAHRAAFRRPGGKLLTLIYGSASGTERDTTVISLDRPRRPRDAVRGVDSVFVVGDVHGEFASLAGLLRRAGVVDSALRWTGGRAHLVVAGDVFDRGPDATRVWWLLYRLEREARLSRGAVDVLLGNHEIMTLVGDTSYLAPKESLIAQSHRTCYACLYDVRGSVLGRWLASKPAVLAINDAVFVHGGVTPLFAELGIRRLNDATYRYLREPAFPQLLAESTAVAAFGLEQYQARLAFFFHPESPFWFRGYVQADTLEAQLDSVLRRFKAELHVVGHTPVQTIVARYGGKLIPVNVADFATELLLLAYSEDGTRRAFRVDSAGRRGEL